jgi:hypothetical protein
MINPFVYYWNQKTRVQKFCLKFIFYGFVAKFVLLGLVLLHDALFG